MKTYRGEVVTKIISYCFSPIKYHCWCFTIFVPVVMEFIDRVGNKQKFECHIQGNTNYISKFKIILLHKLNHAVTQVIFFLK